MKIGRHETTVFWGLRLTKKEMALTYSTFSSWTFDFIACTRLIPLSTDSSWIQETETLEKRKREPTEWFEWTTKNVVKNWLSNYFTSKKYKKSGSRRYKNKTNYVNRFSSKVIGLLMFLTLYFEVYFFASQAYTIVSSSRLRDENRWDSNVLGFGGHTWWRCRRSCWISNNRESRRFPSGTNVVCGKSSPTLLAPPSFCLSCSILKKIEIETNYIAQIQLR